MRNILLIIIVLIFGSCSKTSEKLPEKKVLEEVKDEQGKTRRKVTTGYIPGEDLYLTIEEFDSYGNVIREFGSKPYGAKFKTEYKYDNQNRLINKIKYDFGSEEFENYKGGEFELYSLKDTIADFDTNRISEEARIWYDDKSNRLHKKIIKTSQDSTGKEEFEINSYIEPIEKN